MRGEDYSTQNIIYVFVGSPPHARGRRALAPVKNLLRRITPACAGKTVLPRIHNCSVTDHPRMRGEDEARSSCV